MAIEIPDKTYFKIGEASSLVGVKPYIIRYWETEFRMLRPAKTKSNQRLFRQRDIRLLLVIRTLLHGQKYTIEGARRRIKELQQAGVAVEAMLEAIERPIAQTDGPEQTAEEIDAAAEVARLQAELEVARSASDLGTGEDELRALLVAANARAAELETELLAARRQATRLQAECTTLERRCEGLTAERDAFASAMRTRWRRLAKSLRRSGLR